MGDVGFIRVGRIPEHKLCSGSALADVPRGGRNLVLHGARWRRIERPAAQPLPSPVIAGNLRRLLPRRSDGGDGGDGAAEDSDAADVRVAEKDEGGRPCSRPPIAFRPPTTAVNSHDNHRSHRG